MPVLLPSSLAFVGCVLPIRKRYLYTSFRFFPFWKLIWNSLESSQIKSSLYDFLIEKNAKRCSKVIFCLLNPVSSYLGKSLHEGSHDCRWNWCCWFSGQLWLSAMYFTMLCLLYQCINSVFWNQSYQNLTLETSHFQQNFLPE